MAHVMQRIVQRARGEPGAQPDYIMRQTPLALALGLASVTFAHAETLPEFVGETIVVTPTRTAQTADESLASVTVITRRDIERSQAGDLMALLDQQAGINVARTGGEGKSTAIFVRGAAAKHVLVLVDGVRAASATLGEYDWNALSPEQIERIEIVRGPFSSLYGSDAIGGVIQIFTRRAVGPGVKLTAGSRGTRALDFSFGGGDAWRYSVEAGRESTDGLPTFSTDSTAYGFNRNHLAIGVDGRLAPDLALVAKLAQSWGRNELDANTGDNDYKNRTASLRLDHRVSAQWRHSLTLGNSLDRYTSYSPFVPARIETKRNSLSWQHDLSFEPGQLSLGLDYWTDHASKDNSGLLDARLENTGLFAQYRFAALGGEAQLGARRDKHDAFGSQDTWNLRWGRELAPGLRVTAGHGTAFKAPTVNDLYWPNSVDGPYTYVIGADTYSDTYLTHGNPTLRPETSRTSELGLSYRQADWGTAVNLYETRVDDLIEWKQTVISGGAGPGIATTYDWQPENVSSARMRGLELSGQARWLDWDWRAGLTRLLAVNLGTGTQLDRRPQNSFTLSAARTFGSHGLRIEGSAYSPRLDVNGTTQLAGYGLVNAAYEYALNKDTRFGIRVDNLFDKDYALARTTTRFYETPGRSLFVSLRYQPGK
ncbi:MAG: TonB-dependent receptor [Thiobacillus sp.]|nr:TonB-dependent receptor [Thiobacillus sp.]